MTERKINLPPALLGKAIDAVGVDGVTRLHEHYVTIVDPDRLAALERLHEATKSRWTREEPRNEFERALDDLARMEAETK